MIMPDYPIEDKEEDKLRRAPLAKKVSELVAGFQGKESFVIGIEGVWGSGKTSFVNLVLRELKSDPNLVFINFNPWNFSGQNELITDFFSTLIKKIEPFLSNKDKLKKVKSIISKLTKKSEIAISPEVTALWGAVHFKVNDLFKFNGEEKTLEEERRDIDALFKELSKKVVIVIDDIDRLDTEETRLVMKLVKMTANFPNTVFVLCYDREKVIEKLNSEGSGDEYLKKIIQVSFTLPMPDEQGLKKILFADLDKTIKDIYGEVKLEGNDEKRWNDLQYKDFLKPFKTVRDIKRYISSLRLNWSIVEKEDVNQIDFMAIEAIRVFAPSLYSGIAANGNLFTGATGLSNYADNIKKNLRTKFKELIDALPEDLREPMKGACEVLFPQLDTAHYGSDWEQEWKKERRICASERFGFYFQLGIPEGSISEVEVNDVVTTFGNQKDFSERVLELAKDNRLRPMLVKVLDRIDTLTEEQVKVVISTLWDFEKDITDEKSAVFDFDDIESQTSRIAYHAIKHQPADRRLPILEALVSSTKTFYPSARFVSLLVDQQKKHQQSGGEVILTDAETNKLRDLILAKISKLAQDNRLQKEKNLIFALYRWKEWAGEEIVKEYIKKLISSKKGLLIFLRGFVGRVLSTNGNYNRLDKKGIEPLYPVAEIELLVNKISEQDIEKMDEKDKEAIQLYKNPPKQDW